MVWRAVSTSPLLPQRAYSQEHYVSKLAINIDDIHQASERIRGQVRRTPCLRARFFRDPPGGNHLSLT